MTQRITKRSAARNARTLTLIVAAGITGCNKSGHSQANGQAVAKVNGTEITTLQMKQVLQETGADPAAAGAAEKALETLIDQQLLFDEAAKSQLDRDPKVLLALESSRRQILAQAYVQRMIFPQSRVVAAELQDYYEKNPLLFAERKIYQFRVFSADRTAADDNALKTDLDQTRSSDEVRAILHKRQIAFVEDDMVRPAEQLPLPLLGEAARAKVGDIIIVPAGAKTLLLELTESDDKPLSLEEAGPYIEQFLLNTRNQQALQDQLKRLRAIGQITYLGDFANKTNPAATTVPEQTATATPREADAAKSLEKGLSQLK